MGIVEFNFPHGDWFRVIINVDLTGGMTEGTWEYIVDGVVVIPEGTPFTQFGGAVPTSLGAVSLFSTNFNHELCFSSDFIGKSNNIQRIHKTYGKHAWKYKKNARKYMKYMKMY